MITKPEHLDGLTEATASNIIRKSTFVDRVTLKEWGPIPSWIDLNPTELCNRKCIFCPRVDEDEYPNQALHISLETVKGRGFIGLWRTFVTPTFCRVGSSFVER